MKILALAVFFLTSVNTVVAQNESLLLDEDFITDARQAIDSVYNLNYDASLDILSPWMQAYPDNPAWIFWPALEVWWKILPDLENTDYDDKLFGLLDDARDASNEKLKNNRDIDALIISSLSYGFTARHLTNRGSWYQSLRQARMGMNYFKELEQLVPDLVDIQFGLGLMKYFMAYFTEQYPVIRPFAWMLPKGDKEEGLERMGIASRESIFLIPETTFFLGHIYLHYERDFPQAIDYLEELTHRYPNNGYYHRLLIRSHFRNGNFTTAMTLSEAVLSQWENKNKVADRALKEELYMLRGRILNIRRENDTALDEFIAGFKVGENLHPAGGRRNFLTSSYYLGEIYLNKGEYNTSQYFLE
ncbi:MAG: tetratricopeptide repeat protein, partial [Balneolales bacterium]